MRIAIPLTNGKLAMHFGHCERFALIDVADDMRRIQNKELVDAPPHEPGKLPPWLAGHGVNVIIAGGMGQRALELFAGQGITVVTGAQAELPEKLVTDYLTGALLTGVNACDH